MKELKRMLVAVLMAVLFGMWPAQAADSVEPQTLCFTNYRAQASETLTSAGTLYQGGTLRLTNCVAMAGTTATNTIQGLDGVTVAVAVGTLSTNIEYTASVTSTNLGKWSCDIVVPSLSSFLVQVKVTDSLTNTYIYPSKVLVAETSLF